MYSFYAKSTVAVPMLDQELNMGWINIDPELRTVEHNAFDAGKVKD